MTDLIAPIVVDHDKSILFLSEKWLSAEATSLTVSVYRTPGTLAEAEVRNADDELLLTERIDFRPMFEAWLKDLLDRAGKVSKQ